MTIVDYGRGCHIGVNALAYVERRKECAMIIESASYVSMIDRRMILANRLRPARIGQCCGWKLAMVAATEKC